MSNIRTSDIKSNVVDTVRSLKKKKTLDSEERSNTTSSKTTSLTSVDKNPQLTSSSVSKQKNSLASSKIPTKQSIVISSTQQSRENGATSVKRSLAYVQDENTPVSDENVGTMNSDNSRSNVFARLASKSNTLAPKKRLKKTTPTIMNFFEPQFNQSTLNLIEALVTKSNTLAEMISGTKLTEEILIIKMTGDQHFMLCFKNMLMELQKSGEISRELKFISKTTLNKLEKFVIEKVEVNLTLESLDNEINEHYKKAKQLNEDRIKHLKSQLLKVSEEY